MIKKRITAFTLALLAPLLFGLLLFSAVNPSGTVQAAPAVAPVVNTLADENDGCAVGSCSLRDAIADASAGDTITFGVTGTIVLSSTFGELSINKDLIIDGGAVITVSGGDAVRAFNITSGNVTLESLAITNGKASGGGTDSVGGGIISNGTLTISNSILSGNEADISGGAIGNIGTLTVISSSLISNSADYGGGVINGGVMTATNSSFVENEATVDGGGINNNGGISKVGESTFSGNVAGDKGGAIWTFKITKLSENLTITNSTLSGNWASEGGAIHNQGNTAVYGSTLSGNTSWGGGGGVFNSGPIFVANSTLSGNSAGSYGGGILQGSLGDTIVQNSTVSDNRTSAVGGGIGTYGGPSGQTTLKNSIVSGNVISGTTTADDIALFLGSTNSYVSDGYNLIGNIGADVIFSGSGDITDTLPSLAPLAANGGDTLTHALLPGSLAIDNGECSSGPAVDQRSVVRTQDSDCDTGAYESRGFNLTLTGGSPQSTPPNSLFASPLALTVSSAYSEPVEGGEITFSAPLSGAGVTFTETLVAIGGGGAVSLPVTANGTLGSYEVYADSAGNLGDELTYELANEFPSYLLTVSLDGSGSGTVTASGIDCYDGAGADCTQNYVEGTEVTLVAAADSGSTFTDWSGSGCSGTGNCVVTMSQARSVTATFTSEERLIFLSLVIRSP